MKSKYTGIGAIAMLIGVVALSRYTQSQQNIPPNTVMIQNFAFSSNNLTVKTGRHLHG
jgi:hypothetical protein